VAGQRRRVKPRFGRSLPLPERVVVHRPFCNS
jgi:hypothetical protein